MSRAQFYRLMSAAIRTALNDPLTPAERAGACHCARVIAHELAIHNTKFDYQRFLSDANVSAAPISLTENQS